MKRSIVYLLLFFFATTALRAQEFNVGTNVINVGIGSIDTGRRRLRRAQKPAKGALQLEPRGFGLDKRF